MGGLPVSPLTKKIPEIMQLSISCENSTYATLRTWTESFPIPEFLFPNFFQGDRKFFGVLPGEAGICLETFYVSFYSYLETGHLECFQCHSLQPLIQCWMIT